MATMTVREYTGSIRNTVKSFWHGLSITLSHLVRRPVTVQYPDRTPLAFNWRSTVSYFWRLVIFSSMSAANISGANATPGSVAAMRRRSWPGTRSCRTRPTWRRPA